MKKQNETFDWRKLPDELAARSRDLWKAGLGVMDMVEEQGERLVGTLRTDRTKMVEEMQEKGSKAMDDLQTEANRMFDGFVKRGEKLQKKGADLVEKTTADIVSVPREWADTMEKTAEKAVASVLQRMDIPSRSEVHRLTERVERLTLELRRMAARMAGDDVGAPVAEFEVIFEKDAWQVREVGGETRLVAANKGEAVKTARELARKAAPAHLRIMKLDGSLQDEASYE